MIKEVISNTFNLIINKGEVIPLDGYDLLIWGGAKWKKLKFMKYLV